MIKIIKKISIAMLTASILFATIGTSTHAASKDNKKIQYYKEYQSIIKKVNTSKNKHLQLKDFSAISEKNLLTPTKFEKVVKGDEVADYNDIVATSNLLRSSSDLEGTFSKTKSFSVTVFSTEKVTISCKVSGKYIYDRSRKRCLFGTLNSPKFTVKNGKWIDRGYGQKTIDAGRTLTLTVTGKVVGGTNVKKPFRKYFEFPMNTNGDIG